MKKMLAALCAAVMTACAMAAPVSAEDNNIYNRDVMAPDIELEFHNAMPVYARGDDLSLYEKGDVNLDGEVDVKDANLILAEYCIYTLLECAHFLDENQRKFADLGDKPAKNGDKITFRDANIVLGYRNYRLVGNDVTMDEFLEIWKNNREAALKAVEEAVKPGKENAS